MHTNSFAELAKTLKPADQRACQISPCGRDATHVLRGVDGIGARYALRLCAVCHLTILSAVLQGATQKEIADFVEANRLVEDRSL